MRPGSRAHIDGWPGYAGLRAIGYDHKVTSIKRSHELAHELMPRVHRVASLLKRWILATHQVSVSDQDLEYSFDESAFRFNRRRSRAPGLLFYRLLQQAVHAAPAP
ncbi:MAG: transposase [Planctomycetes bacterium]|nr:transposase [Planctomycetota bacterium]